MRTYGMLAEFATPGGIVAAARRARSEGYTRLDAYSPVPVEGLAEAVGFPRTRLPFIVLLGGLAGAAAGFGMQYYAAAVDYPLNIGGRPPASWPAFAIVAFELAVLGASLACVLGMFILNGLPRPYHPVFNVPEFSQASRARFFLCIEAADPKFDSAGTRAFLESMAPAGVWDVDA